MRREAAFKGQFYPASTEEVRGMIQGFNEILEGALDEKSVLDTNSRVIIAPHAGYVFSGFTANVAYRLLQNSELESITVIGPSHHAYVDGVSVGDFAKIDALFEDMDVDEALAKELKERFSLGFVKEAHHEHSTETQFPFVSRYFERPKLLELVYGKEEPTRLAEIIKHILKDPKRGVVISSDLSHFHTQQKAREVDNICLNAVQQGSPELLHRGCEACGILGIEAVLIATKELGLAPMLLDYRTSADASGDTSRVVGYMSAAFVEDGSRS